MSYQSRRLKQLENELLAPGDEAMLLEELDGFIIGILVCPEVIPPSEWLRVVWGQTERKNNPVFDNLAHMNRLVTEHYNDIARKLFERPDRYPPLFAVDNRNGHVLWELWIDGFEKAVKLRPSAWQSLLDADIDTAKAMSGLLMVPDIARRVTWYHTRAHMVLPAETRKMRSASKLSTLSGTQLQRHHGAMTFQATPPVSSPQILKVQFTGPQQRGTLLRILERYSVVQRLIGRRDLCPAPSAHSSGCLWQR